MQFHSWRAVIIASVVTGLGAACGTGAPDAFQTRSEARLTADQCNYFDVNGTTRICHATGSASNPYVVLNIGESACVATHTAHPRDYVAIDDPTCSGQGCLPLNAPCDGTLGCCEGMTCRSGSCQPVDLCANVSCTASDQCHVASCDPTTGACLDEPKIDGWACDDGSACTQNDVCRSGVCTGSNPVTFVQANASAINPWTDSGVFIPDGGSVVVTATGQWSIGGVYGTFDANGSTRSPNTESCMLAPDPVALGTLIGSLDDGVTWFAIGTGPTTVSGSGELLLSVNDCPGPDGSFFSDNTGSLSVSLTTVCLP